MDEERTRMGGGTWALVVSAATTDEDEDEDEDDTDDDANRTEKVEDEADNGARVVAAVSGGCRDAVVADGIASRMRVLGANFGRTSSEATEWFRVPFGVEAKEETGVEVEPEEAWPEGRCTENAGGNVGSARGSGGAVWGVRWVDAWLELPLQGLVCNSSSSSITLSTFLLCFKYTSSQRCLEMSASNISSNVARFSSSIWFWLIFTPIATDSDW